MPRAEEPPAVVYLRRLWPHEHEGETEWIVTFVRPPLDEQESSSWEVLEYRRAEA